MNFRGLILAAIVLVMLGGVLYWSQHHKASGGSASAIAKPVILKFDPEQITQLTLQQKGAEQVTLVKANTGNWGITEPQPLGADQDAVSGVLATLSALHADRVVENNLSDPKQYGFDPPTVEVGLIGKDYKAQKLLVGDDTPAGGDAYAMLQGDPRVFKVAGYDKSSLNKGLNDLRDKRLLTMNADKVSRVDLLRKAQEMEFGRTKDGWQIVKPKPLRADSFAVDELVRNLSDARMNLSGAGTSDAAAEFTRAAPIATAKLTGGAGTQTLEVRKNKSDYYAKSSIVEGAYEVDSSLGQALEKNLDDFRNKKLFDFDFNQPDKITLRSGSKTWTFTYNGSDWWSNGIKMDAAGVEPLIEKLRGLTASKFADSGFTNPEIEATVTSNDGKLTEKIAIAKSGDQYIAKRENEPSLYQLDPGDAQALAKLADGIKPAANSGK